MGSMFRDTLFPVQNYILCVQNCVLCMAKRTHLLPEGCRLFPERLACGTHYGTRYEEAGGSHHVDGSAEVIRDDENGFLVPPRNPEAMAEKVIYLLPHPGAALQMGDGGSQEVGKYDYSLMVSRLEELYRHLIEHSDLRLLIAKRGTPRPG